MPAVLVPLSFSCLLVHVVSRLTLMSSLRRMSCIPHLVHVSRHLFKLLHSFSPNCTIVCTTTCLEEVYYTAVGCLSFFFLFSFCRLGGIIVISGVRICKVAIFNC